MAEIIKIFGGDAAGQRAEKRAAEYGPTGVVGRAAEVLTLDALPQAQRQRVRDQYGLDFWDRDSAGVTFTHCVRVRV